MAIELQDKKIKKNYFVYILIVAILVLVFYFLINKILKDISSEIKVAVPATDITRGLAEIQKEKAGTVFVLPIFKTLVKYTPASVNVEHLGRSNPFATVSIRSFAK